MFGKTSSILVFIGNLPPQVSRKDLKSHIRSVIGEADHTTYKLDLVADTGLHKTAPQHKAQGQTDGAFAH